MRYIQDFFSKASALLANELKLEDLAVVHALEMGTALSEAVAGHRREGIGRLAS